MIGTVVVDGYTYQITQLTLRDSHLVIMAWHHGPVRPCTSEPATVFGKDGTGICQSWLTTITPSEAACDNVGIQLKIKIIYMETEPA